MTLSQTEYARLNTMMQALQAKAVPFAMATVVRTVNATSAKPGGKALLDHDGNILMGWIGGGCARGAVGRAAKEAITSGAPQFISLRPQELLDTEGLAAGDLRDGVRFARNGCPSKGTMDVFIEPVLPLPQLKIFGTGLVALALAELGGRFDFKVTVCAPNTTPDALHNGNQSIDECDITARDFVVIATQGQGDLVALRRAISGPTKYTSFVGSARKFKTLAAKLSAENSSFVQALKAVHAPAGLDIRAITPDEIALSILAQITRIRRSHQAGRNVEDG
jgi:xanthine dehydrogenase accessory factor